MEWKATGNKKRCEYNSQTVANLCSQLPSRSLVFLGAWIVRSGRIMESICKRNDGRFLSMRSSNISCLQCLWERRITKQKRRQEVKHFNGSHDNIELLLRTVISANHISIYWTMDEVPKDLRVPGKLAARDHLEKMEFPTDLSIAENSTNAQQRWNLVQEYERKIRTIVRRPEIIQSLFRCGFEACRTRTILLYSWYWRRTTDATSMPRIHDGFAMRRGLAEEDGFSRIRESVQSWT